MSQDNLTIAALVVLAPVYALAAPRKTLWLWRHGNNPLYDKYYRGRR